MQAVILNLLKDLRATLKEEMAEDALAGGGLVSWSEEQENY